MTANQRYPQYVRPEYTRQPPQYTRPQYTRPEYARQPRTAFVRQPSRPSVSNTLAAPSYLRDIGALAIKIAAISISFTLIFTLLYGFHRHTGPDMSPMVRDGDIVLFYRLNKGHAIGDLVLVDIQGEQQVRRVVANTGDTVDITDDGLIINGGLQYEPEIFQQTWRYANGISFPITVGEGQVFVLGDARENAHDSREYGPVSTDDILGNVITIIRRRHL